MENLEKVIKLEYEFNNIEFSNNIIHHYNIIKNYKECLENCLKEFNNKSLSKDIINFLKDTYYYNMKDIKEFSNYLINDIKYLNECLNSIKECIEYNKINNIDLFSSKSLL